MSSSTDLVHMGFDVGGTSVRAALVDRAGRIYGPRIDEPRRGTAVDQLRALHTMLVNAATADGMKIDGAGLCLAGSIDVRTGRVVSAPTAPELVGLDCHALGRDLGVGVMMNDANAALWGAAQDGAASGVRHAVGVFIGRGVGGAVIADGEPLLGANGVAAEIGHMVIADDGLPCACGGLGCLEQYASGTALARRYAEMAMARGTTSATGVTGEEAAQAALTGDPTARAAFRELAHRLAGAIATLVNVFNPEIVIIGGGLAAASSLFLDDLAIDMSRHTMPLAARDLRIAVGALGRFAGVIGAAAMVRGTQAPPAAASQTSCLMTGSEVSR
jgi:glucokinase